MNPVILFAVFTAILVTTFGVAALFGGSSDGEQLIEKRIISILVPDPSDPSSQPELELLLKARPTGRFGWLNELLQKYPVSEMLETRIIQANSKMTPAKLLITMLILAIVGVAAISLFIHILAFQILAGCVLGYIPFGYLSFKRSRRINAFNAALPDAIDMMGRALRAGHSMTASISIVAEQSVEPVRSEFSEVFKQQNFGLPIRDALGQMLEHVPSQDLRVLVTGILVQKDTGGNLAEILDRTANTIRERLKIQGEIRTHTAQGRMTGYILCALPIVMLVVINLINPGYSNMLLDTDIGQKLVYIGLGLLVTGGLIIRQIINGIEV
jgi:tight adherence protein B